MAHAAPRYCLAVHPSDGSTWHVDPRDSLLALLLGRESAARLTRLRPREDKLRLLLAVFVVFMLLGELLLFLPELRAAAGQGFVDCIHVMAAILGALVALRFAANLNVGLLRRLRRQSADAIYIAAQLVLFGVSCGSMLDSWAARTFVGSVTAYLALWFGLQDAQHPGMRHSSATTWTMCVALVLGVLFVLLATLRPDGIAGTGSVPLMSFRVGPSEVVKLWPRELATACQLNNVLWTCLVLYEARRTPGAFQLFGSRLTLGCDAHAERAAAIQRCQSLVSKETDLPRLRTRQTVKISPEELPSLRNALGPDLTYAVLVAAITSLALVDLHTLHHMNRPLLLLSLSQPFTWMMLYLVVPPFAALIYLFGHDVRGAVWLAVGLHTCCAVFYDALHPGVKLGARTTYFVGYNFIGCCVIWGTLYLGSSSFAEPLNAGDLTLLTLQSGRQVTVNAFSFAFIKITLICIFIYGRILIVQIREPGRLAYSFARVFVLRYTPAQVERLLRTKLAQAQRDVVDVCSLAPIATIKVSSIAASTVAASKDRAARRGSILHAEPTQPGDM